jgi:branched-chain amino acid aminotransferase
VTSSTAADGPVAAHAEPSERWPAVIDGERTLAAAATIPVLDDGLIRGDGAFDAFRLYAGRPFAMNAHLDRLERSCAALGIDCPRALVERDIAALLDAAVGRDAILRYILTRGGHRLCLLETAGDREELSRPAALLPVPYEPSLVLDGIKSLSYGANMLASRRARAAGADEALLVRGDGVVLEGPTCSIFWVSRGRLRTPSLDTGILASITRGVLIDALDVEQGAFELADLQAASEAFLASTGREAQPVARVGDASLPAAPGPVTLAAQAALRQAVHDDTGVGPERG